MTLFKKMIYTSMLLSAAIVAQAQSGYEELAAPQKTDADGKVEVLEFFWYGCPHCFQFEAHIGPWHEQAPDNVKFVRMAPPLNPAWKLHSQAYYAAELMGVLDKFHEPMFDAIHRERKSMRKPKDVVKLAESLGIDGEKFQQTMNSFAVDAEIRKAMQKARDYQISAVPTVIINGKYSTSGSTAGNYANLISVLDQLVEKESGS